MMTPTAMMSWSKGWRERAAPAGNKESYFFGYAHSVPVGIHEDATWPNVSQGEGRSNSA
jgi:hypothetical protein